MSEVKERERVGESKRGKERQKKMEINTEIRNGRKREIQTPTHFTFV